METLSSAFLQKLSPKLRMVCNGNEVVNTLRAELASAVAVKPKIKKLLKMQTRRDRCDRPRPDTPLALAKPGGLEKARGKMPAEGAPSSILASVFIELVEGIDRTPEVIKKLPGFQAKVHRKQNLVTASVPLDQLEELGNDPAVSSVELGEKIVFSPPVKLSEETASEPRDVRKVGGADVHKGGEGVLIGIIDVEGFDFAHPDFLDQDDNTRFISIWDQGGEIRPKPAGFEYGSEITRDHLNDALRNASTVGVSPQQLEPQSQMAAGSHGTHVASIAAGANGICPKAELAGVLISLPSEDQDRRSSFYDSTRLAHAVDYLFRLGQERGLPVSINISLGTNGHAHDASSPTSRWIDYALATPGRSVCVAAGNAGQEAPAAPDDWGFVLGRIHTSGRIPAAGLSRNLEWIVVGDGIADISENELEIWYSPQDRFAVELKPPDSNQWIGPVEPGQYIENQMLPNGTFISIYNERYAPANGHNYIACYLSPFFSPTEVIGVRGGTWTVRLIGREVRDGTYHGWIERDDPQRWGSMGVEEAWSFPSFFSETSNVDNSSVSSLACGHRIVSVANLDDLSEIVNITSSQGPTRDNRQKPEIAAPGTDVVAAGGFDPDHEWAAMSGTSMASPYVAGVIGLMLAVEPSLTAAQIGGIIRRTARPLPGHDFQWKNDAGFGRINPEACIQEAQNIKQRMDLTP